ncbi:uncharacterized protein [Chelonus insularis]|uniref:uncharacterized protein n=1 Tax=Chelonus insularis TaxID=460826 RepID=UPI00158945E2|nr:uncharacterized protein LOC118070378 [Chelonus insularis]XP_034944843.1 uncharacterized protein LOC118070378 [Chelonus insularis]
MPQAMYPLKVSLDAAFHKRGTGRSYNSLSAHSSMYGHYSKKLMGVAINTSRCSFCEHDHPLSDHYCKRNWAGSAKAMEPDMAIQLIVHNRLLQEQNAYVSVLIGDDDSSTLAAVKRNSNYVIGKWSDLNHATKGFTSALYSMKVLRSLITYFSQRFSTAIKRNKDNSENVRAASLNVVNHAYGEHGKCDDECPYRNIKGNYAHLSILNKKPLADVELRVFLAQLFVRYANVAEKLAPCGSTQINESFNNCMSSKNAKSRHYAASSSLHLRVLAAAGQNCVGTQYVIDVYNKWNYSPETETKRYREAKDRKRKAKSEEMKTVAFKRRRLFNKKKRVANDARFA